MRKIVSFMLIIAIALMLAGCSQWELKGDQIAKIVYNDMSKNMDTTCKEWLEASSSKQRDIAICVAVNYLVLSTSKTMTDEMAVIEHNEMEADIVCSMAKKMLETLPEYEETHSLSTAKDYTLYLYNTLPHASDY